jgi:hypothetical protein
VGRFRKIVEFDQSKGIGRLARPRRSRFGYWFGRPTTIGGAIVDKRIFNFGGPIVNESNCAPKASIDLFLCGEMLTIALKAVS